MGKALGGEGSITMGGLSYTSTLTSLARKWQSRRIQSWGRAGQDRVMRLL